MASARRFLFIVTILLAVMRPGATQSAAPPPLSVEEVLKLSQGGLSEEVIITQIKKEHIPAVFLENVTDSRLLDQIAKETGAKIGGTLYSDALSEPNGPAGTYLDMFRNNIQALSSALSS